MTTPFHITAKQFVYKVIRLRFELIRRGISNNPEADSAARDLHIQLTGLPYDSDIKMASFFTRYQEQLEEAIPGGNAGCGPKLTTEYNQLLEQAKSIIALHDA